MVTMKVQICHTKLDDLFEHNQTAVNSDKVES